MGPVDPRVDVAFKKIFGVEGNEDLLISLINSIVGEEDQVKEVTLINPYNLKSFKHDKLSIVDIKAKGSDGKRFNIEIQISDEEDYNKRALYYWAKLYTEQLKETGDYATLSKAIGIHILNFTSILGVEQYHNVFHISEKKTGFLYFKDLELHTIELKKFTENVHAELADIVAKVKNSLDMWVAFLTRHDLLNKNNLPVNMNNPALKKALDVIEAMGFSAEERQAYEDHLKWLRIESSALKKCEKQSIEKGEKIGFEKGEKIGFEKGEKIGIEKGEKVGREKSKEEVAIAMLIDGMVVTKVAMLTKLSIEQVAALADTITHKK